MKRLILGTTAFIIVLLSGGCSSASLDETLVVPNTMSALVEKDADLRVRVKLELFLSDDIDYDEDKEHEVEIEYLIGEESYKVKAYFEGLEKYAGYRILTIQYEIDNINIRNTRSVNIYLDKEKIVNETKLIKSSIESDFDLPSYEDIGGDYGIAYADISIDSDTNEITYYNDANNLNFYNLDSDNMKIVKYYYDDTLIDIDDKLNIKAKNGFSDYSLYMYIVLESKENTYLQRVKTTINSRPWERFMGDYVDYLKEINKS